MNAQVKGELSVEARPRVDRSTTGTDKWQNNFCLPLVKGSIMTAATQALDWAKSIMLEAAAFDDTSLCSDDPVVKRRLGGALGTFLQAAKQMDQDKAPSLFWIHAMVCMAMMGEFEGAESAGKVELSKYGTSWIFRVLIGTCCPALTAVCVQMSPEPRVRDYLFGLMTGDSADVLETKLKSFNVSEDAVTLLACAVVPLRTRIRQIVRAKREYTALKARPGK